MTHAAEQRGCVRLGAIPVRADLLPTRPSVAMRRWLGSNDTPTNGPRYAIVRGTVGSDAGLDRKAAASTAVRATHADRHPPHFSLNSGTPAAEIAYGRTGAPVGPACPGSRQAPYLRLLGRFLQGTRGERARQHADDARLPEACIIHSGRRSAVRQEENSKQGGADERR